MSKKIYWLIFSLIFLLGIFLIFYRLDQTQNFFYDVARDMEVVRQMVVERKLTLLGPRTFFSTGNTVETYFGPLHYYLVAVGLIFSRLDPIGPAFLTGFFGIFGSILFFLFLRRTKIDPWFSLLGFFFYVISPLIIIHSRFPWNPNFLPFFTVLILFIFKKFIEKEKVYWLLLLGFFSGCLFQLHYIAAGFILPLIITLYFLKPIKFISKIFYWIIGFIFGILPIIIFELRHNFFLSTNIFRNISFHSSSNSSVASGNFFFRIIDIYQTIISRFFGVSNYTQETMSMNNSLLGYILSILFLIGFFYLIFSKKVKERKTILFLSLVLFFSFFLGPFFQLSGQKRVEDRYFLSALPVFITLLVFILEAMKQKLNQFKNKFLLLKIISFSSIIIFIGFFNLKKDLETINEKVGINSHSVNMQGAKKISSIISDDVKENKFEGKFNIANIVDGNTRAIYYRYFLNVLDTKPLDVDKYPQTKILYVISDKDSNDTLKYSVWEIESFAPKKISGEWKTDYQVKIYRLIN